MLGHLEEKLEVLRHMEIVFVDDGHGQKLKTVQFRGVNVRIVNGLGATNGYPDAPFDTDQVQANGLGNLIIGYCELAKEIGQEPPKGNSRTGSHNLVMGNAHRYTSIGGLVAGKSNSIDFPHAAVVSGALNQADAKYSVIVTGGGNATEGSFGVVVGGQFNHADGEKSAVLGGTLNSAPGAVAVALGGSDNCAQGGASVVGGGQENTASGTLSFVVSGSGNEASGLRSAVLGGRDNEASGEQSAVGGGTLTTVSVNDAWGAGSLLEN